MLGLRDAGEAVGHEFHGNQWTGVAGDVYERRDRAAASIGATIGSMHVSVHPSPHAVTMAEKAASVLAEMKSKGYTMPGQVAIEVLHGPPGGLPGPEAYVAREGAKTELTIHVPANLPPNADLERATAVAYGGKIPFNDGHVDRFVGHNLRDLVIHEMGHVQTAKDHPYGFTWPPRTSKSAAAMSESATLVSRYAGTAPNEFIAEAFTRLYRGEKLAPDSQKLYDRMGGPRLK